RLEAVDFHIDLVAVELRSLVEAAAEVWHVRCAKLDVNLQLELPDRAVIVSTDPGRLRQVVDVLLSNALYTLPAGTPLVLAVRSGVRETRDGGPGLAADDLVLAFRPEAARRDRWVRPREPGVMQQSSLRQHKKRTGQS